MKETPSRNRSDGVLATLRALVPDRQLTYNESLRIAELQANRLLELLAVSGPRVPSEIVSELPRVEVRHATDLPVSASAHWENGRWVITLNGSEANVRLRFSLMHEFKHVLDHTTRQHLYGDVTNDLQAVELSERAADQFAACVLMPKKWVKREWFGSGQQLSVTARQFDVSTRALAVRLWKLGLAPEVDRCLPQFAWNERSSSSHYLRRGRSLERAA